MSSAFYTSSDSEDDTEIEELCKLANIKYQKPSNHKPTLNIMTLQSSTQAENTFRQLSTLQPENSMQVVTNDDNSEMINMENIEVIGDFSVVELPEENGVVSNGQPTPSTSKPKQTPKITILQNILLPPEKIFHGEAQSQRKRQNKVNKNSKKWQRELNKKLREEGKSYLGYRRDRKVDQNNPNFKVLHDTFKPAKDMGPRCESTVCQKSNFRECHDITELERRSIFDGFWKTMSWEQRRQFICSTVTLAPCKRKVTKNETSRKSETKSYYLLVSRNSNVTRLQVCRGMFLHTLGLSEWFLRYWLDKTRGSNGIAPKSETSLQRRKSPKKKEQSQSLTAFFDKLPKLPSHYCRQTSSRLYLEPTVRNISELYEAYKNDCQENDKEFLSRRTFDNEFLRSNLSLYMPKKDQCDFCCSFKEEERNRTGLERTLIIDFKNHARKEKLKVSVMF